MTRTGPTINPISWDTKPIVPDDGSRIDSVACQDARPKGRIRRSMTACNTCRKLKTRCDVDPRGHSCRRCLSLRFVWPFYLCCCFFGVCRFHMLIIIVITGWIASSRRQQSGSRTMHQPGPTPPLYHRSKNGLSLSNEAWGR